MVSKQQLRLQRNSERRLDSVAPLLANEYGLAHTVYCSNFAIEFSQSTTTEGLPTVQLSAARKQGSRWDWEARLLAQLTMRELPQVAAVILGRAQKVRFSPRGKAGNKGLSVERQEGRVFVSISERTEARAVPIGAGDLFWVASLFTIQLRSYWGGQDAHLELALDAVASVMPSCE